MKKLNLKGILCLSLATLMLVSSSVNSLASSDNKNVSATSEDRKISTICKKYDLKTVTQVPANIKPLEIKDSAELEKFLKNVQQNSKKNFTSKDLQSETTIKERATGSAKKSYFVLSPAGSFNIRANYEYLWSSKLKSNYYSKVTGVSSDMTGLDLFITYTADTSLSNGTIQNNGLELKAHCEGTADWWLFINGTIKVASSHESHDYTFTKP